MSGPTTAILIVDPLTVLLSAAAIRAAMSIEQGYQHSAALLEQQKAQRSTLLKQQQNAALTSQQAIQQHIDLAETELRQLQQLANRMGIEAAKCIERPTQSDSPLSAGTIESDQLIHYLTTLQRYNSDLKSILLTNAAKLQTLSAQFTSSDVDQLFQDFATDDQEYDPLINNNRSANAKKAHELLKRIQHLGELPESIHLLAQQFTANLPLEREELVLNELRRQIQLHLDEVQQQQVQLASALILRQSLKDLGYQVEEFSDTLFIEGGVAHFRRHGWGDYMVRLRINEHASSINFNVIRAVQNADNERSILDHLAEDRWCSEFPTLLKAMEARGLTMNVTRRLEAGELPVQLVQRDLLPKLHDAEQIQTDASIIARKLD